MKKFLSLLLALAMALSLAACGSKQDTTPDTSDKPDLPDGSLSEDSSAPDAEITEGSETPFVVAFDQDNLPFSYLNDAGELVGFSVDVAREACARNGWELMAEPIDWKTREEVLSGGTVDCIWGQGTEAEMYAEDSEHPWLTYGELFVDATALIHSDIDTLPQLEGRVIEVEPDALFAIEGDMASQWGKFVSEKAGTIIKVESAEAAYRDLFDKKCDAVITNVKSDELIDLEQFDAEVDEDGYSLKTLYSSDDDDTSEMLFYHGIGASFTNYTDDYERLNETLYEMAEDGTISVIMQNWDNTPWGSVSNRFTIPDYSDQETGIGEDEWEEDEEDEYADLTDEELAEMFGDLEIIDISDEP